MKERKMIAKKLNSMKKSTAAILAVLLIGACCGDVYQSYLAEIEAMQNAGAEKLAATVDTGLYRQPEQEKINGILESTEAAIRESKDQAEIDKMIEDAAAEIGEFKTDAEYTTEEGVARLEDSVDLDQYREAEQKEIKKILKSTKAKVLETGDKAEIDKLIKDAKDKFAGFKTDAEYSAEEEAARQAAAAAAAAKKKSKSKKKKSSGSQGCVGTGSDVFN